MQLDFALPKDVSTVHRNQPQSSAQVFRMPLPCESCLLCGSRKAGFFCNLSPDALTELDAMGTHCILSANAVLFEEAQKSLTVAIVCEGRLKLTRSSREGKTLLVRIAKAGDILGLSAALSEMPYEVTAQAIEHTHIRTFPQKDFVHFIQSHAGASLHAAQSLSREYRAILSDASRLALSTSVAAKVAHLLLELSVDSNTDRHAQPELHMSLKHEDLAAMLGSSRESITRVLNKFKRAGVLSIKGTRMILLKKETLEHLV